MTEANVLPTKDFLSFDKIEFDYDPYPVALAKNVLSPEIYQQFLSQWPPAELYSDGLSSYGGVKLSLSENQNPEKYLEWVNAHPLWRNFYEYVKSKEFIYQTVNMLRDHHVDQGLLIKRKWETLQSRFEFSMLPADGGGLLPHTDAPGKVITMVIMMREDGWDDAFGGGTAILKPKDITKNFNYLNKYLSFEEVTPIKIMPFEANNCVVFVKTFNSLHAVLPMTGKGSQKMRKTLTINIIESAETPLPKKTKDKKVKSKSLPLLSRITSKLSRIFS